jgi:hypothetical protein
LAIPYDSVDRELDDEKDVVWGKGHKKQTKGALKYDALLAETALRYNAAGKLEKRSIVDELVAGLSFVHLKDGRACKELGKEQVMKKTMRTPQGASCPCIQSQRSNCPQCSIQYWSKLE